MQSFTAMSDEAIKATIDAMRADGEHYPIELNPTDFEHLLNALTVAWNCSALAAENKSLPDADREFHDGLSEWCADFVSGIAQTLDVEMI
jgi:hypothetical protein